MIDERRPTDEEILWRYVRDAGLALYFLWQEVKRYLRKKWRE